MLQIVGKVLVDLLNAVFIVSVLSFLLVMYVLTEANANCKENEGNPVLYHLPIAREILVVDTCTKNKGDLLIEVKEDAVAF